MQGYRKLLHDRAKEFKPRWDKGWPWLLSMARVDPEADDYSHVFAIADVNSLASCHPTAEFLLELLGKGEETVGIGELGMNDARSAIVSKKGIVHVQYAKKENRSDGHSFVLLSSPDLVESLEGWAGEDGFQLHECVFGDRDQNELEHDEAWKALRNTVSGTRSIREAAFNTLSRAGGLEGFSDYEGKPLSDMQLTVTCRGLKTGLEAKNAIDERLEATFKWVARAFRLKKEMEEEQMRVQKAIDEQD